MNNKGFYNDNKEWTEKIKNFFKESGFYIMIVLGLCVLAVGAVYFTTNHLISSPDEFEEGLVPDDARDEAGDNKEIVILDDDTKFRDESIYDDLQIPDTGSDYADMGSQRDMEEKLVAENTEISDENTEANAVTQPAVSPTLAPAATKAPDKPVEKAKEDETTQEVIKLFGSTPVFIMPVEGKILMDYAMDRLIYSKTLDEWRTHSGIDISAPRGEAVKAVADGYVKEIKNDPCYGVTITIDHENGYKSIYSNLASGSMVSTNQKVKAGDPISSVGNTAIFECMDPPHLHFEMYKNDKLIDPKSVLPISGE